MVTTAPAAPRPYPLARPLLAIGAAGRIGLVALATDLNSETDLRRMAPEGVEVFTNRVANANPVTLANLRAMQDDIGRAVAGILPDMRLDAVVYACTSGTVAIGEDEIERRVRAVRPGIPVVHPIGAIRTALAALGARRIALLAPYSEGVTQSVAACLGGRGLDVVDIVCFGLESDETMAALPHDAIFDGGMAAGAGQPEALVVACTALRAAEVVERLEDALGLPVVTSNQAMLWQALRLIGNETRIDGFGRLMHLPLPA